MPKLDLSTVGGRIRYARTSHQLTTKELAGIVSVAPGYLSMIERSARQPSKPLVQRIADATGVTYEWLLDIEPAEPNTKAYMDDVALFLAIVMQQGGIDRKTAATVLAVSPDAIDKILSGDTGYDPLWEYGLLSLSQRLDLRGTHKKLQAVADFFLAQADRQDKLFRKSGTGTAPRPDAAGNTER